MQITPEKIASMPAEEVDGLFRSGEVGQIPDGDAEGRAIFFPGKGIEPWIGRTVRALAWKGKVVSSRKQELKNKISPFGIPAVAADVYWDRSWFDGGECIVLDYSRRSLLAHFVRDEIRRVAPGLYLGLVYWRRRRLIYFTLQFPQRGQSA